MNCPVCESSQLVMSERAGIEIDFCPKCRGIWLDRGELDKIIERSDRGDDDDGDDRRRQQPAPQQQPPPPQHAAPGYPPPSPPGYPPPYGYGYPPHKYYKKKSFWHELFDD